MTVFSKKIRNGRSITTILTDRYQETTFHEIDNLDSKTFEEAQNNYEKVFIVVRDFLKDQKGKQFNLDSEALRLTLAQGISDQLRETILIRRDAK